MRNDYDERDEMNAIQRERMERRAATRRKSVVTTAVFAIVALAVVAGIIFAITALVGGKKNDDEKPTAVTATISSETKTAATKATENGTQSATQSGQQATQAQPQSGAQSRQGSTDVPLQTPTDSSSSYSSSTSSSAPSGGGTSGEGGNVMHYYAYGQTSYGYDWTYSGGGGIVAINCGYSFDNNQYDFTITGLSPGTTTFTLYYNTADGVQQPVNMTVNVDDNLNVTQIG